MEFTLDFERPVLELENQIKELKQVAARPNLDLTMEIENLQRKVDKLIKDIYTNLTPWERVLLARHPARPHSLDFIQKMIPDFHPIHGDRHFAEDKSVIAGFGHLGGKQKIAVIGIEKGRKTSDKIERNFGMPRPEGYRKALRVMKLAAQFQIPILTLVDTPGAFPGIGAEERGQSQAIAENLVEMFQLATPIVSLVIGEGGSGGALAVAIADRVMMMEYSIYSVISPESCASILWSDPKMAETAANALQLGPGKALELKVIDSIINEPPGGAHRHPAEAIELAQKAIEAEFKKLLKLGTKKLLDFRFQKFRSMGNNTIGTVPTLAPAVQEKNTAGSSSIK